jgi:23S rRNA (adenine2503-C2)-methyltransferase
MEKMLANIKDYTLPELEAWLGERGERPFRARQVFQWLYQHRATEFAQMSSLGKELRATLAAHFHPGNLELAARAESADGSTKFAFALADGRQIETVLMPNLTHYTVCVSTQVGCAMGCDFCATAQMGLVRNLSPGEIVQQVVEAARAIDGDKLVRNVVFMGMGEPLHNFDALKAALEILQSDHGFGLSARRLTVSTSGLVPAIRRYAREGLRANLAVSLNAVDDTVRTRLMPVNRRWNIAALLDACREVPAENRYRITFEYVLLAGLTDRLEDAHRLVRLLHGFKCKVNLIPYNAHPDSAYRAPTLEHAHAFQRILLDRGVLATIRISKGQDIQAACGQLVRQAPPQAGTVLAAG